MNFTAGQVGSSLTSVPVGALCVTCAQLSRPWTVTLLVAWCLLWLDACSRYACCNVFPLFEGTAGHVSLLFHHTASFRAGARSPTALYYFVIATGPKQTLSGNWPHPILKPVPQLISLKPVLMAYFLRMVGWEYAYDQITPKCLLDNPSPGILSVFTSHPMQSDKPWAQGYFWTGERLRFVEYHQYNGRGRRVSWRSTATGPHANHLRVTRITFHSLSLFPDISALMGVSLASWLACQLLGCTHKAPSLVVAQAQDRR